MKILWWVFLIINTVFFALNLAMDSWGWVLSGAACLVLLSNQWE